MKTGYSDEEYQRVRPWILAALDVAPDLINEAELIDRLRDGDWLIITTDNAACVLEFFVDDHGQKAANILVIGGRMGAALREIMAAFLSVCDALRQMEFAYIQGQPRAEWAPILKRYGFEQQHERTFIKRL